MNHFIKKSLPEDSATVAINSLAQQKIKEGIKIYNLSAGEPKLPPIPQLLQRLHTPWNKEKPFILQ